MKRFRRIFKFLFILLLVLSVLLVAAWMLIKLESVQNRLLPLATEMISDRIGAEVHVDHIDIEFFKTIVLDDVKIFDQDGAEILNAEQIKVELSLFSFIEKKIVIDEVIIDSAAINLYEKDGKRNFQHILDKLSGNLDNEVSNQDVDKSKEAWLLGVSKLTILNSEILVDFTKQKFSSSFEEFSLDMDAFVLGNENINADEVILIGANILYVEKIKGKGNTPIKFPSLPFGIGVDKLKIADSNVKYDRLFDEHRRAGMDFNHLEFSEIDIVASNLLFSETISGMVDNISLKEKSGLEIKKLETQVSIGESEMQIDHLRLETNKSNLNISASWTYDSFDDLLKNPSETNIDLDLNDTQIAQSDILLFLENLQIKGIEIDNLNDVNISGKVKNDKGNLIVQDLRLSIGDKLDLDGNVILKDYNSPNFTYDVYITDLATSYQKIKSIIPAINLPAEIRDLGYISGAVSANGNRSEITIDNMFLESEVGAYVTGSGKLSNLASNEEIRIDFDFEKLVVDPNKLVHVRSFLPEEMFRLGEVTYHGIYAGDLHNFSLKGDFSTDLGGLNIDAHSKFTDDYNDAFYSGNVKLINFDVGALLQDTSFGIVSLDAKVNGRGVTEDELNIDVNSDVKSLEFNDYTYTEFDVEGKFLKNTFTGFLNIEDPNIDFTFQGKASFESDDPIYNFSARIDTINFKALNFTDSLYTFSGEVNSNISGDNINNLLGNAELNNVTITTTNGTYLAESDINIMAYDSMNGAKLYKFESPFLDANLSGNIQPTVLADVLGAYVKDHIPVDFNYQTFADNIEVIDSTDQNFKLKVETKNINPVLHLLTNGKILMKSGYADVSFIGLESKLDVRGLIDSIYYNDYLLHRGSFFIDGKEDFINGNMFLTDVSQAGEILMPYVNLDADLNQRIADLNLEVTDDLDTPRLLIGGNLSRTDEYVFKFHDSLLMNDQVWKFSDGNQIFYGPDGLFLQDVRIFKGNQGITIYTDVVDEKLAIEVLFDQFNVSDLSKIVGKENKFFDGGITGVATLNDIENKPFITSSLDISDIILEDQDLGVISIQAEQDPISNKVIGHVILKGPEDDAKIDIVYDITNGGIDGKAKLEKLGLVALDPFLTKIIKDSEGFVDGAIDIGGTINAPDLNGILTFHKVKTTPVFTNAEVYIDNETVHVKKNVFDFKNMELTDAKGNKATASGVIRHQYLDDFRLDLRLLTEKFQLLNTTVAENEIFYGDLTVSADVTFKGPLDNVLIEGAATSLEGSSLSISPLASESQFANDDFIIFKDPNKIKKDTLRADFGIKNLLPIQAELELNVNRNLAFKFIIDPITGDKLTGEGNGNLLFKIRRSGNLELFGTYSVEEGKYDFSYGFINKSFDIKPGGTVQFNGDPLDGKLNVEALYPAYVTVYDLLRQESDLTDIQQSDAQRKIDLDVGLLLNGSILSPDISLDINADPEYSSSISDLLDRKLDALRSDPDEMNNQVFGLLLFNSFILSNTTSTSIATTGSNIAIGSISGLITSQLNKLAGDLIGGVQVNFDFNSYRNQYLDEGQGGLVTELGVGLEKQLFDDRLIIKAGTNINLESSSSASEFNAIAGDFLIEYKLTKDGNYRVKVFSKSNFDRLIDQNSNQNGVSLTIRKEFGNIKKKANTESKKE